MKGEHRHNVVFSSLNYCYSTIQGCVAWNMRWSCGYWLNYETNPPWHPCFCCYYLEQSAPWNYFRYAKAAVMCLFCLYFCIKVAFVLQYDFKHAFTAPFQGESVSTWLWRYLHDECWFAGLCHVWNFDQQHLRRFDFCLADICPRRLSAAVWNARVALERRAIRRDGAEHPEELKNRAWVWSTWGRASE